MKDLPDLLVFISSFCSLHLSLLCSALSLLSHSLSAFPSPHLLTWLWISLSLGGGCRG